MAEIVSMVGVCQYDRGGNRRVPTLRGVSLSVAGGEIVGIVGSSLEGGTSLLQMAAGWVQPDAGQIRLGEVDLTGLSRARRERLFCQHVLWIGSQEPGLQMRLTVNDYIAWPILARRRVGSRPRISPREADDLAWRGLEYVGAHGLASVYLEKLTFWERLLVELGRIVASRRQLIVIDDRFDGLGPVQAQRARRLLRSVVDDVGCGVLLRVSDLTSAGLADRGWRLDQGELSFIFSESPIDRVRPVLVSSNSAGIPDATMPAQAFARIGEMPTISRFLGITISMYFDDHEPPHFHARAGEFNAKIRTDTLELLAGDLPRRELRLVLAWAELHAADLQDNWRRVRAGETLRAIEPLR